MFLFDLIAFAIVNFVICISIGGVIVRGYPPYPSPTAAYFARSSEICSINNGRKIYLDLGDSGHLKATNITLPNYLNKLTSNNDTISHIQFQCSLELVTCPSCIIKISITLMNFSKNCQSYQSPQNDEQSTKHRLHQPQNKEAVKQLKTDPPCNCDYLFITEPPYDSNSFGKRICGNFSTDEELGANQYVSRTRAVSIKYFYRENHMNVFALSYVSERNKIEIIGKSSIINRTTKGITVNERAASDTTRIITSPFFPSLYPRDYSTEYLIFCKSNYNTSSTTSLLPPSTTAVVDGEAKSKNTLCRIRVIFTDFQIGFSSTMEFYDSNGQRIDVFSGAIFRPPVIISTGPSLLLRFTSNSDTGYGFRANVKFLSPKDIQNPTTKPFTDCGGLVETLGGAITMMNMVKNGSEPRLYDCIWLIRPASSYLHLKTHLSLRVDVFHEMAGKSDLIIRQGMTSDYPELGSIRFTTKESSTIQLKNYVVPMNAGFYVSLSGLFGPKSRLALVYTAFSYMDCYVGSEFLCQNHRCIPIQLQCDGFDNCGDNSDESDSCSLVWDDKPMDRRWYSPTPNYYFPKMDRYPDLKTATIIFFASSLGLIFLISALIILLYRIGNRARHQRELQSHLQTISELLDNSSHQEDLSPEEPPAYEAPPDYDEIIKVDCIGELNQHGKEHSRRRKSRSSNPRSRRPSHSYQNAILEVNLPTEMPISTTTSEPALQPTNLNNEVLNSSEVLNSFVDSLMPSRVLIETEASCPSTSTDNTKGCQTNSIPNSPPPTYRELAIQSNKWFSDSDNSITEANNSETYGKDFEEDLIYVSFSVSTPPINQPLNIEQNNHTNSSTSYLLRNTANRIQTSWLGFKNDEPAIISNENLLNPHEDINLMSYGMINENLKKRPSICISIASSTSDIATESSPLTNNIIEINKINCSCKFSIKSEHFDFQNLEIFNSSESIIEHIKCLKCNLQFVRKYSIDDASDYQKPSCFGPINLFGNLLQNHALLPSMSTEKLLCDSPTIAVPLLINDEFSRRCSPSSTLLQRSSSMDNFSTINGTDRRKSLHKSHNDLLGLEYSIF